MSKLMTRFTSLSCLYKHRARWLITPTPVHCLEIPPPVSWRVFTSLVAFKIVSEQVAGSESVDLLAVVKGISKKNGVDRLVVHLLVNGAWWIVHQLSHSKPGPHVHSPICRVYPTFFTTPVEQNTRISQEILCQTHIE